MPQCAPGILPRKIVRGDLESSAIVFGRCYTAAYEELAALVVNLTSQLARAQARIAELEARLARPRSASAVRRPTSLGV